MICAVCGSSNDLQNHHLAPRALNGENNLTVKLCFSCHRSVHGLDISKISHSELTKEGLKLAKIAGKNLGWSIPGRQDEQREAARKGAARNAEKADRHAANVLPVIRQIAARGASLRQIADELNTLGIKTARGGLWYAATVRNVMARETQPI